ncbi:MAG: hypothetical protein IKO07_11135 [Clostridia bacterium]|nr:hypothetical protein [Clostridia bacterium]
MEEFSYDRPEADVAVALDHASTRVISPLLFGDNLEHTRACVNGGLSAEVLKNRKFVGHTSRYGCANGWYPIGEKAFFSFGTDDGGLTGSRVYTRHGEGYRMRRRLERNAQFITNYAAGRSGIGQEDLYVRGGIPYECSLAVKALAETKVAVSLLAGDGTIHDSGTMTARAGDYKEIALLLTPAREDPEARLEITFDTEGTLMIGAASLMPSDHFHGMRRDVIEKMKEIGIRLLRWPGGNFSGEYHWKDGLLPRNIRAPLESYLGLETQPHTLGYDFHEINTDDFVALCREIGAEPFITINPAWNTPEESAQWVEYCNGDSATPYGKIRADRGYPKPYGVKLWSLGNEAGYGHMEGANTPEGYAKNARAHAEKMLAASPGITLCSSGPYPNQDWVENCAKKLTDVSGVVSLHHYTTFPAYIDPAEREHEYNAFIREADTGNLTCMQELSAQLKGTDIKISYDEWNAWHAWYRIGSVSEGIFAAAFQNMLFRNADKYGVTMACHFESVNEGAIMVHPDRAELAPAGVAFSLMKEHAGGTVRALEQDVTATHKDSVITCTLLNRAYAKEKRFTLRGCGEILSAVLYRSEDVVPTSVFEKAALPVTVVDGTAEIVLPPHSIAQIRMAYI